MGAQRVCLAFIESGREDRNAGDSENSQGCYHECKQPSLHT